jgi:hypothetical protein
MSTWRGVTRAGPRWQTDDSGMGNMWRIARGRLIMSADGIALNFLILTTRLGRCGPVTRSRTTGLDSLARVRYAHAGKGDA